MVTVKIDIQAKSRELKKYISQFETDSFVTQICYVLNSNRRMGGKCLSLESPVRQIFYLLSLFLSTPRKENLRIFDLVSGDFKYIEQLLTDIEAGYRYNFINEIKREDLTEEMMNVIEVSKCTYVDYFVNAPLNYTEQEVEKIKDIFCVYDEFIYNKTGLNLNDYLAFFDITEQIDINKYVDYQKQIYNQDSFEHYQSISSVPHDSSFLEHYSKLFELVEKAIVSLRISRTELLNNNLSEEKLNKLLNFFSVRRGDKMDENYLFYTQTCPLMDTPIIELDDKKIMIPMQKQLIHAIYSYLFKVCMTIDKSRQRVLTRRDKRLEEKTAKIFRNFLGSNATIYTNYYLNNAEKDLLVLYRDTAFIIECKACKNREPFMDVDKAFTRIKDDFRKSIQKGYDQAAEVNKLFQSSEIIAIKSHQGKVLSNINTRKYRNVFTIVVTQERLGQIQIDLGLLLDIKDDNIYPWSVCVDDLESILLTLSRRESPYGDFLTYLSNREKLHGRVWCFDELELVALYLTDKARFIDICNRLEYFLSNPHEDHIFDFLYNIGFGFENERGIERKHERALLLSEEIRSLFRKVKFKCKSTVN